MYKLNLSQVGIHTKKKKKHNIFTVQNYLQFWRNNHLITATTQGIQEFSLPKKVTEVLKYFILKKKIMIHINLSFLPSTG
jgi:hypothetical protein